MKKEYYIFSQEGIYFACIGRVSAANARDAIWAYKNVNGKDPKFEKIINTYYLIAAPSECFEIEMENGIIMPILTIGAKPRRMIPLFKKGLN